MSAADIDLADEVGPIDFLVLEFPGDDLHPDIASAVTDLLASGTVRLLDLVLIRKAADGTVTTVERADLADDGSAGSAAIATLVADLEGLVTEDDIARAAEAMEPGTSGGLLVWENTWAAPFANAIHRAGGEIVSSGRIPLADVLRALDEIDAGEGDQG